MKPPPTNTIRAGSSPRSRKSVLSIRCSWPGKSSTSSARGRGRPTSSARSPPTTRPSGLRQGWRNSGSLVLAGGGPVAAAPGLPDAGAVTGWTLRLVGVLAQLAGVSTVGCLLVRSVLVPLRPGVAERGAGRAAARAAPPGARSPSRSWCCRWPRRVGILAVKVLLVVVLGALGHRHRRRTLPRLAAGRVGTFVGLAGIELLMMNAAVGLASALARTPTPPTASTATPGHGLGQATVPSDLDPFSLARSTDVGVRRRSDGGPGRPVLRGRHLRAGQWSASSSDLSRSRSWSYLRCWLRELWCRADGTRSRRR